MSVPTASPYTSCCPRPVGRESSKESTCSLFLLSNTQEKVSWEVTTPWPSGHGCQGAGLGRKSACACLWLGPILTNLNILRGLGDTHKLITYSAFGPRAANASTGWWSVTYYNKVRYFILEKKFYYENSHAWSSKFSRCKRIGNEQMSSPST